MVAANKRKKHGGKRKARKSHSHSHSHKGHHVAKKRKSGRKGHRRGGPRRRRGHGGGGGLIGGIKGDIPLMLAGAGVAWMENQAKDANFILNKVPKPISQLGYTGNLAIVAYVAAHFAPGRYKGYIRQGARAMATIAAYQMARKSESGQPFKEGSEVFTISGPDVRMENMLGDDDIGALDTEMGRHLDFHGAIDVGDDGEEHPDAPHPDDAGDHPAEAPAG